MNKDFFLRHIENSRGCEQGRLDAAVRAGLRRAQNERLDARKLFALAAASVFICALFFTASPQPFEAAVANYYRNRNRELPGSAEALDRYAKHAAANIRLHLGGK